MYNTYVAYYTCAIQSVSAAQMHHSACWCLMCAGWLIGSAHACVTYQTRT